jgi:serine/threonine protein phosphatase PrpC
MDVLLKVSTDFLTMVHASIVGAGTGVYRVNGNLALSRAVGDKSERPYVSGEQVHKFDNNAITMVQGVPDIVQHPLDAENDQFIILATDGLWDVMSSSEAVNYVHR